METVKTKKSVSLCVATAYLSGLYTNACDLLQDSEYLRRFKALEERVNEMFATDQDGDIIDEYVVIEQEIAGV